MRILFTGGGTGGHVFPILAVKRALENIKGLKFYYLGANGFARKNLADPLASELGMGIEARFISAGKLHRFFSPMFLVEFIKVFVGIIQSFWYLFLWVPDIIFSKGGFGSFPVVFVARIYRIPVILHESDSAPGLVNRISAKFAKKIILSFPGSENTFPKYKQKLSLIGNPIRKEITQGTKEKGRGLFKIKQTPSSGGAGKPVVLIMGGSQGARKINEIVLNTLPRLLEMAEIIHVAGKGEFDFVKKESEDILESHKNLKPYYHLYKFFDLEQVKQSHAIADLVVNRAGAASIFEIAACGKASILIPIPKSAQDHQRKNAFTFSKDPKTGEIGGRAVVLDQDNLTPNLFLDDISKLITNPAKLKEMGEKARAFYNPQTPDLIAKEIIDFVKKN